MSVICEIDKGAAWQTDVLDEFLKLLLNSTTSVYLRVWQPLTVKWRIFEVFFV